MAKWEVMHRLAAILAIAAISLAPSAAFSYHESSGRDSPIDWDTLITAILPISVVVVAAMVGLGFWGRKKPRSKAKRRKAKRGR